MKIIALKEEKEEEEEKSLFENHAENSSFSRIKNFQAKTAAGHE